MRKLIFLSVLVVTAFQFMAFSQDSVLMLDGDGDYVDLGQADFMPVAYTLEIKIFTLEESNKLRGLISKDGRADGSGDYSIFWGITGDNRHRLHHFGDDAIGDDLTIPTREWVHLSLVFTGSKLTFYTNGVAGKVYDDYNPSTQETVPWRIGIANPEEDFQGLIDETRIWNYARTTEQIQATMAVELTGNEEGLVGYWNFNDQTARDLSASQFHGNLVGDSVLTDVVYTSPDGNNTTGNGTLAQPYQTPARGVEILNQGQKNLLCLLPGIYTETNISLQKQMTVWGAGKEKTVLTNESGEIIKILSAQDVHISGLTIDGQTKAFKGIYCDQSKVEISHNRIIGAERGIGHHNSQILVRDCEILNNNDQGIEGGGNSNITILDNLISGNRIGIASGDQSTGQIKSNHIKDNKWLGVYLTGNSSHTIDKNLISNNAEGISITNSANPTIVLNIIHKNRYGILIHELAQPLIGGKASQANTFSNSNYDHILNYASTEIDATYNYWGLVDEVAIKQEIVNVNDGEIKFKPFIGDPQLETANRIYDLHLSKGLNMISLPLEPEIPYSARSLAEKIGDTSWVMTLDQANQQFVAHVPAIDSGNGFLIEGGKGYIINTTASKQISFNGQAWSNPTAPHLNSISVKQTGLWALVLQLHLPHQLRTETDLRLQISNASRNTFLSRGCRLPPVSNSFRLALADQSQNELLREGDLVQIEILDQQQQTLGYQQITVTADQIQSALLETEVAYNPIPEFSQLLQNYPNPFNPETWIPFQIKEAGQVKLVIYDFSGHLVRQIEIGQRPAGIYSQPSRAIYWDGKTELGQTVSSGIYFYTLTVGSFSQTRRLVIAK